MHYLGTMDRAPKRRRWINVRPQGCHGIAEDCGNTLPHQQGHGFGAAPFHAPHDFQQVRRRHVANGQIADVGENVSL